MIQRIQTIYLLLAGIANLSLFALPIMGLSPVQSSTEKFKLFADRVFNLQDNSILLGAVALTAAVVIINIFLFKNRKLQININNIARGVRVYFDLILNFQFRT